MEDKNHTVITESHEEALKVVEYERRMYISLPAKDDHENHPVGIKWATAFREETYNFIIKINNGVERQNRELKHGFLKDYNDRSLSGLMTVLVEEYLPDKYNKYIEANSKYSGRFRKYNALVPEYLKHRPRPFVDHCLRRLTTSEDISEHDIVSLDPVTGLFRVKSKRTSEWYNLSFGGGEQMPRCSFKDWLSSFMPCKHFLAVMRLRSDWSWRKLPEKYVNSPLFVTDSEIEFGKAADVAVTEEENTAPDELPSQENVLDAEIVHGLPKTAYARRSKASACREVLGQLKSLSYLVDDDEAISELLDGLIELREDFKCHVQQEDGIDLDQQPKRPICKDYTSKKSAKIPLRLSRKQPFSGRVGVGAGNKRKAQEFKIDKESDSCVEDDVEEMQNLLKMYKLPDEFADYCVSDVKEPKGKNDHKREQSCTSQGTNASESNFTKAPEKGEGNDRDQIAITGYMPPKRVQRPRQRVLKFTNFERVEILDDHMLTDLTINLAQNLLKKQYPENSGFEDTLLGIIPDFSKHTGNSQYIQILHTGSLHWVCISNVSKEGCLRPENVHLYDSLNSKGTINPHTQDQIADYLYLATAPEIFVDVQPVQQQTNGTNCGLFAIAYAVDLANNEDPTKIRYDERRMRSHLVECLTERSLTPFPRQKRYRSSLSKRSVKRKNIEIFCICRKPYRKHEQMADCDKCGQWFHRDCENIPDEVFKRECHWECSECNVN